jgi:hypothetical protein
MRWLSSEAITFAQKGRQGGMHRHRQFVVFGLLLSLLSFLIS